ncbi:MAG TPA: amino acid adenylation domain-containing protein [Ktedonosporobacter sp.]|jgi:amino acid adenylation domain-containing protein|nr:amino acid adenylation domain-containing protein [Ktedonosporobacter sp.]
MQTAVKGFRLSPQQARLWSIQQGGQVFYSQGSILLEGKLDREKLLQALRQVLKQHEILRTVFYSSAQSDIPMQVIIEDGTYSFVEADLIGLSDEEQHARIKAYLREMLQGPSNLEQAPLMRTTLLRLAPCTYMLLVSLPALCADAVTLQHLFVALSQIYEEDAGEGDTTVEQLQYADTSTWLNSLLQTEEAQEQQARWRAMEIAQAAAWQLPFERRFSQGAGETFEAQVLEIPLKEEIAGKIVSEARRYQVAPTTFLLACWQSVLWHLSSEAELVVGVACDGRHYEELATALGPYTRFVPISTAFAQDPPFERALALVNNALNEAIELQDYFTWEACAPDAPGGREHAPLFFPLAFEARAWPASRYRGGVSFSLQSCFSSVEPFSLKLVSIESNEQLRLELHYNAVRLSEKQAQQLARYLLTLIEHALAEPQTRVSVLHLLTAEEQQHLLQSFLGSEVRIPPLPFQRLFEEQVARAPEQTALVCGSERLTYQQLNSRSNRIARWLRRQGVGPDTLVGLCMERSATMLVGLLAILKAGGAYVPLEPEQPAARLLYQMHDTGISLVLTQQRVSEHLPQWEGRYVCLDEEVAWSAEDDDTNLEALGDANTLAYVIYTSGSTGVPKGVMIRQCSVVNYTHWMQRLVAEEPGLHFATVSTLAADLGNTAIFCSLASGGCLHILPYELVTDGEAFSRYVEQHPIDVLKIVPSHLQALLATGGSRVLPRRFLILGGEALSWDLLTQIREQKAGCVVLNHYGPTEATIGALVNVLGDLDGLERWREEADQSATVPLGPPIANMQACILDKNLQIVPVGVTGEIYLGGVGLAAGYWRQQQQTRERFLPHSFGQQETKLYRTGDLARYTTNGLIEYLGRADNQVKLRGYRIELEEIEAVIRSHPDVNEGVVIVYKEQPEKQFLVGYVVMWQQPGPTSDELRRFVQERLPAYMVPAEFIKLRKLPLTSNGKIDLKQLPPPGQSQLEAGIPFVAPRTPAEEVIAAIVAEVLKVERIGIHDNFFVAGGNSLLAIQVVSRVRHIFQTELSLVRVFNAPTVSGIVEEIVQIHGNRELVDEIAQLHQEIENLAEDELQNNF